MRTYRRVWTGVTLTVLVVGCLVLVVGWCLVSPWTFAAALVVAYGVRRLAFTGPSTESVGQLVRAPVVDTRRWYLMRVLPLLPLAVTGWSHLLGTAGAWLPIVDAVLGLPLLVARNHGWPDRLPEDASVDLIPDTVEQLVCSDVVTTDGTSAVLEPGPAAPGGRVAQSLWPGPHTLLPDLDDTELLHAWEASARILRLHPDAAAVLGIVAARANYLDALAERDPDGFGRRLALGEDWSDDPPA